jgi:hypothetical protein
MGKYTSSQTDIFSVFDSAGWKAEGIHTFPADYQGSGLGSEFVKISIIPSGAGVNRASISGLVIIDIFTPAGLGPNRQNVIADKLDTYLQNKFLNTASGGTTQFFSSALKPLGQDKANPSLSRSSYEIPFKFFGVIN